MAMEAEAAPVRAALGLEGQGRQLHPAFPARLWANGAVALAVNGTDPRFGVDSIGTQPAVTTTLHAIELVHPSLVVSAGTCGGFAERAGTIGSVYLASSCGFHDRRIDIPAFDEYGRGDFPVADLTQVAEANGWATGHVTTGNALDAPAVDLDRMGAAGAVAKEMEAAAVAWVCERLGVPFTALKVVTDLVDHHETAADQFLRNLELATAELARAVPALLAALPQTTTESVL